MNTPWTDDHSRLTEDAAPEVTPATDADLDRVWNIVGADLGSVAARGRGRARAVIGAGVVTAVLGVSGYAAAEVWSAHTGRQVTDEETLRLSGPGEYIDPYAPDFPEVYEQITDDIAFPDAASRKIDYDYAVADSQKAISEREASGNHQMGTVRIEGELRAGAARSAICAWTEVWAQAAQRGDNKTQADATDEIKGSLSWPAVTDVDPVPAATPKTMRVRHDDGTVSIESYIDNTPFGHLPALVDAVHGTDVDEVRVALHEAVHCWPELVPSVSDARMSAPR